MRSRCSRWLGLLAVTFALPLPAHASGGEAADAASETAGVDLGTPPPPPNQPPAEPSFGTAAGQVSSQPVTPAHNVALRAPRSMKLYLGPGFGLSGFDPDMVNRFIEGWEKSQGTVAAQSGFPEMYMAFVPRLSLAFAPIEYVEAQVCGEIGWAPKVVVNASSGESRYFAFTRYSIAGAVNGHLPLKNHRFSLYAGGGLLYHYLSFEGYSANALGYRGQVGFRIHGRTFVPDIFLAFDYVKATTNSHFELDFTSGTIGANFYFDLTRDKR